MLAVSGLAVESRLAAGPGVLTVACGGRSIALASIIEREIAAGAKAIISFGIAGALIPVLSPGALVVASAVVSRDGSFAVDADWTRALLRLLSGAISAPLAGSDAVVADPVDKARLHELTGACAVDMESHVAARIAAEHGLPFAALRAIADPLARTLPPAAKIALTAKGDVDVLAVLGSLARTPRQLPRLLHIAFDTQKALGALARGRRLMGSRLGYTDLDELSLHVI